MATYKSYGVAKDFFMLLKGAMLLLLIMVGFERVVATQYTVGDSIGWGLGNDLESWSSQFKFYVGDDLYFSYPTGQHSVLLVTEDDYKNCNIDNPITTDGGAGDMVITLISSETYYFICGVPGHCAQGLRLSIQVEPEAPSTTPDAVTPPPPDVVTDHPPPPHDVVTDHPPPPHDIAPPHSPPDSTLIAPTLSPPYYSKYNTFHRNSAPPLYKTILAYSLTAIIAISCTLFML